MLPAATEPALRESWRFFVHLAVVLVPLFIGGSFLVGLAEEYLPPEAVERKLRGHDEGAGNVLAAGFGAVTPFCSCSTVPALAGLLQAGAPLGLAFSFLLASPLVNEIAVILLLGVFGLKLTAVYVVTTFTAAVGGGIAIGRLGLGDHVKDVQGLTGGTDAAAAGVATDGGTVECGSSCSTPVQRSHRTRVGTAARGAWSFFVDTLPYLLVGMTVGALIHGVVPVAVVQRVLGPENPLAVPLAALAGAPIYVSMSGMLPIAASLSEQGVPVGTVLAFVIGGAGVSIPNLVLLTKLFERRLLLVYAGTVVAIGATLGVLFNAVFV
ncbi:MAG: permease [Halolamina sp.]|uniref:permease n=1 Tax=Halolamina sp. TaxID=1940283 RepID=UPI002FC2B3EE